MIKKIAIIGTVGVPAKYGGFETLTEYLTQYLSEMFELTVYCSDKSYPIKQQQYNGAMLIYVPLNANGIQSIVYDMVSIFHALFYADVLLIFGVSGCIVLPFIKLISRKKIIVNIDGLEWKRAKWNKFAKWFLKFSEKLAVNFADVVITDNLVIKNYVKTEYCKDSVLIAYGADHVQKSDLSTGLLKRFDFLRLPYALTICRVEPENNVHIILAALSKQESLSTLIIGNWNSSHYGVDLRAQYEVFAHIHLIDPIYDQKVLNQIRSNCFIYLHGHSAGGTNPSLVEAMFVGLPIFAYGVDYNKETTENCAEYFSDSNELSNLFNQIDNEKLLSIGYKMAEISNRRYRWEIISKQYACLFG